ncbi:MAG TPA: patatin-like phospholipase family protein [Solirubrobacterales bacterium]|nr:patatin-like phospholipase family protein [Solirubrobacterales bacterium]
MKADGVFAGGGVKGLAFAGAITAAAEFEYTEWGKLAGTSAGAITAMALAVGYDAAGLKRIFETLDLDQIADYGPLGKLDIPVNLAELHGVTRGKALHEWIEELLAGAPTKVRTFGELEAAAGAEKLQVVGTDIAHTRMVVFPRDVDLYVDEEGKRLQPADFPIADAVRISAGFPYFFPPWALRDAETGKDGVLVDGGVVSAYPVFLFDKPEPAHPTWGFRLYSGNPPEKPPYTEIDGLEWPVDMLEAIVDTSMNAFDKFDAEIFGPRTISIPTGDIETLDFELDRKQKEELFEFGRQAATEFFKANPSGVNTFGATPSQSA